MNLYIIKHMAVRVVLPFSMFLFFFEPCQILCLECFFNKMSLCVHLCLLSYIIIKLCTQLNFRCSQQSILTWQTHKSKKQVMMEIISKSKFYKVGTRH